MLPVNSDLEKAGYTTQQLLNLLLDPTDGIPIRTVACWVVRWRGRIKSIEGIAMFDSRERAEAKVKSWMRATVRYLTARHWGNRSALPIKEGVLVRGLPRNWTYKKIFREFVDRLVNHMVEDGLLAFEEIQAGRGTSNAIYEPIGMSHNG